MPSAYLDFFNDSAWLTGITNEIVTTGPSAIQKVDGLFPESGIDSTKAIVERVGDQLGTLVLTPRGGVGEPLASTGRKGYEIEAGYYLQTGSILADEVQGERGPGNTPDRDTVAKLVQRRLTQGVRSIEYAIAIQQLGAIKGVVTDGVGNVLVDLLSLFGITQPTQSLDLSSTTSLITNLLVAALRQSEDGLAGPSPDRWVAFAAPSFMDKLRANGSVREILGAWQGSAAMLAGDYRPIGAVSIAGVDFMEVRDSFGGPVSIEADTAYLVPVGVDGMFEQYFAPAPKVDAVNSIGLPYYTSAEPMPHGRGFTLNVESCPLAINTRPGGVVKLTA